jgi:amino acid adenylation domain-containing protein
LEEIKLSTYEQSNLTRGQLHIWMGQNLLPEVPIYNLAVALNIHGDIDPVHFGKAFQTLVNSSDALRTVLEEVDGIPMQRLVPNLPYELSVIDFSSVADPQSIAKNWMLARCQIPIQWQKCLFDSTLIKLPGSEFVWYLNIHHMICDGWSFELIYQRMAEFYRRSLEGQLPQYVNLFSYADYIAHERAHRESARHRRSETYWKRVLSDSGEQTDFYGKTPAKTTTRVRRVFWNVGAERTRNLRSMATARKPETEEASLLVFFTAMLVAYLHCLNRRLNYTIGVPFHNRRSKNFKETIGFFSEILPVRLEVSDEDTFIALISKVKREVFKAARHGQCSVANPYFRRAYDVVLNYHTRAFSDFAGMPALPQWVHNGHGDDSLTIQISDFGSSSSLSVDFDLHQEVFSEQDCDRVVFHFSRVVDAFLANPEQPLRLLSLISPEETKQILGWNRTKAEALPEHCIHRSIEEQAKLRPDAVAVVFKDEQLSYQELNRRANQVAHYLRKRGVGPETLVGLYVERSLEMIVGLLGVLKAGAAYVPIHPESSREWVKFVLTDTGTPIVLTQNRMLCGLPPDGPEVMFLDASDQLLIRESAKNIDSEVTANHLAYVIYTSGSTGSPKGVEISHSNLMNFAVQVAGVFGLGPTDRVLQFASIAFDTSVEEIFPCLLRGATLVLRTDTMLESAKAFVDGCEDCGITVLDLPTFYWHDLTASLFSDRLTLPDSVRVVIIGGEKAMPERLALWQACVTRTVKLLNTYGPTETTVTATIYDLTNYHGRNVSSEEIPIGTPIPNVQTHVLDGNLTPVPVGVPGELHIGGAGVARGYLNQPALSAQKFIRNPFADEFESRLYKSGDLVRWRADGSLEYLGRLDRQVKIRGFRVDLDGIEGILKTHPLVEDAAVTQDSSSIQKRLVAYLTPKQGAVLNVAEVKKFVGTKLPEYMMPTTIIVLNSMPLTHGGKVDRRALPNPDDCSPLTGRIIEPPQTPAETLIAALWREVLGIKDVGRYDHFFGLGGHSLLAAQLVSRIRKDLRVEIPLRLIFEAPTLTEFARKVDEALHGKERDADLAPVLVSTPRREAPVSQSQARIWYMHQLAPQSAAYNITVPIRFSGVIQKEALIRSMEEMVQRHDSLRTTFRSSRGEPVQIISPSSTVDMTEIDIGNVPEDARVKEAKRISSEEARRPFDLENGPLIRVLLIRLSDEDHVLLLNMHHMICDQWSLGIIARELTALYNGFSKSSPLSMAGLPAQCADVAIWQDQWFLGERLDAQLAYWKKQLADMKPLALPTDHPRPSIQMFRGSQESLNLSPELLESLNRHAAQENASLYMLFLAAFQTLLCRYSSQHDIALGTPIANRNRLEWEGVVGTLINILVVRTDLSGDPSFRQLLRRVRRAVLDAFDNGDLPFETVVKELHCERDPSRSPLIQVLFNFQSVSLGNINLDGLSWMPFEIDQSSSQFDLSVTVDPEITRKIVMTYNIDLYEPETIKRMLQHYHRLLEAVAANPDESVATISILSDHEKTQLLYQWNNNHDDFPQKCIHELFEDQARKTPDSIAVVFDDQKITYDELDQRANQIACGLRTRGVKPEVPVGVCMERSIDLIVALLGILKAGGAYVPIDPAYPQERITFMIEDSGLGIMLTQEKLLKHLPRNGQSTLCLETMANAASSESTGNYPFLQPGNLAYVIYTSGSTGKPKGVEVEHRSLVNFLYSMGKTPGMTEKDVLLSVTTVSFDIAALEIFLPLTVGARVVLTSREVVADGKRLMQQMESSCATMMQATPTTWRMLVEAGWNGSERFKVLSGGESLPLDLAKDLLKGGNTVWNLYGPTETTVWSTIAQVESNCSRISIGRPVNNTRVYILDSKMEPVPVGIPGELYVGGQGVARGYLKRPELTGDIFVRDPYSGDSQERLFKTGDLARYLADGTIEYLGRIDQQLKIRGHRIEPGEIEATLMEHPAVRQAVVVGQEYAPGDTRLVVYLVMLRDMACDRNQLRSFLERRLPDYMIPAAFVFLEALPIGPGGKVNRQALPPPDPTDASLGKTFLAPRDRLEFQLAQIWQSVLNVSPIAVTDNFFEIGGHSLLAVRLIEELERGLGKRLPLARIFQAPTIEKLANVLASQSPLGETPLVVPLQPHGLNPPFFCHGASFDIALHAGTDQPFYGLRPHGQDGRQAPSTIEEMAADYVNQVRTVQPNGPYYLGGYSFGGLVAFEMAQQLTEQGQKIALLVVIDPVSPMNGFFTDRTYPSSISQSSYLRIYQTLRNLVSLGSEEKRPSMSGAIRWRVAEIRRKSTFLLCNLHLAISGRIPEPLRMFYFFEIGRAAIRKYMPKHYCGRIVFLKAEKSSSGWNGLAAEEMDVHEIPGKHLDLLRDSGGRDVGKLIRGLLDQARALADVKNTNYVTTPNDLIEAPLTNPIHKHDGPVEAKDKLG